MTLPNAQEALGWYSLVAKVYADLKGSAFKSQQARMRAYSKLFELLRAIHIDYLTMYTNLLNELEVAVDASDVESAKSTFHNARTARTEQRLLATFDAGALKENCESPFEKRYLEAVQHYIHGRDVADDTGGVVHLSRSRNFWRDIREISDKNELISMVNISIARISEDFTKLFSAFSKIDGEAADRLRKAETP